MRLTLNIKPFLVPSYVVLELPEHALRDGLAPLPEIPLSDVDEDALEALCKQFRDDVFAKHGARQP